MFCERIGRARKKDHYTDHVTRRMTAAEVRARLLALLDEIESGEEIEITRFGKTVATLAPAVKHHSTLKGLFSGYALSVATDEELFMTGAAWAAD